MFYDSNDADLFSRYWLFSPLRTRCTGVRTAETSTMHRTLCGTSWHVIIPLDLFIMADDTYSKWSKNNRSWCIVTHITLPFALASSVWILSLTRKEYNTLAVQYPCWSTRLLFCDAQSAWIKVLSNRLPCLQHFPTHLTFWTTTESGL